jgi:8-oxo-dGTP diphosphatase
MPRFRTVTQTSAGGVAYRRRGATLDVVLIAVGPNDRWQLPKGIVDPGESPEITAVREVREEAGVDAQLIAPLETIEYWYVGTERTGERVRYHKRVHFYLMEYVDGRVEDHDAEVNEARWVELAAAAEMLSFKNERTVLGQAAALLESDARPTR